MFATKIPVNSEALFRNPEREYERRGRPERCRDSKVYTARNVKVTVALRGQTGTLPEDIYSW